MNSAPLTSTAHPEHEPLAHTLKPQTFDLNPRGSMKAELRIAGLGTPLQALRELVLWPTLHDAEAETLGLRWPKGLLLYGPPGTGKTSLVQAVAAECDAYIVTLSAASVHKAYVGESEKMLREAFAEAEKHAQCGRAALVFIDEIDTLCPHRDARRQQESRLVAQLNTLMDGASKKSRVVVVAATNRVNAIDPSLRRPGRFDKEIQIGAPNSAERLQIFTLYTKKLPLDLSVDLEYLADRCNGYVGADIEALCREAALAGLRRSLKHGGQDKLIRKEDWEEARLKIRPSVVRGIPADVPKVSWEDIGGLSDIKKRLQQSVVWPIKHAASFQRLGLTPDRGVLLHGPPGCSKTTLVRAVAHAAEATLFCLSGAEMYSMYVGEGEALIRETFQRARLARPSIIFFDEVDAIASRREDGSKADGCSVGERLLSTVLTEMDGLEEMQGIVVLGATNRREAIDAALLRPGRFDKALYVPLPDAASRLEILSVHTKKMSLVEDVRLTDIVRETEGFSGAEVAALVREAAMVALRENIAACSVAARHFEHAMRQFV